MNKILCVTGHRLKDLFGYDQKNEGNMRVRRKIHSLVGDSIEAGYNIFISGMAEGADQWFSESVLIYKDKGLKIELHASIPFLGQEKRWQSESKEHYYNILKKCDKVWLVHECRDYNFDRDILEFPEYEYSEVVKYLYGRNNYMVDNSDAVLAIFNNSSNGGTAHCVKYARSVNKSLVIYNPKTEELCVEKIQ